MSHDKLKSPLSPRQGGVTIEQESAGFELMEQVLKLLQENPHLTNKDLASSIKGLNENRALKIRNILYKAGSLIPSVKENRHKEKGERTEGEVHGLINKGLTAREIRTMMDMTDANISRHIKNLADKGLVSGEKLRELLPGRRNKSHES